MWFGVVVAVIVALGIAASAGIYFTLKAREDARLQEIFTEDAQDHARTIESAILNRVIELRALKGLFELSESITRRDFKVFAHVLLRHDSWFHALEWVPLVRQAERAAFEQKARADGWPEFEITELQTGGVLKRAGDREVFLPGSLCRAGSE